MANLVEIFKKTIGRSEQRRFYHPSNPAAVAKALDRWVVWLIDTLAVDQPAEVTIDCRQNLVHIRCLVNSNWHDVSAISDDTLVGIIPGKLTKISAAPAFWEYFSRLWETGQTVPESRDRAVALAAHRLALRLEAFEPARGIVNVRFMQRAADTIGDR